ncbi:MAG: beta-ketoacyl-[acyl-carrier-protein] synthase family protein [Chloroflexaceae bacterium]
MRNNPTHRVVITGMGAISPLGNSVADMWEGLIAGHSGIDYITRFDITDFPYVIGGEVHNFDPRNHMDAKAARRMARFAQFAVAATGEALRDSDLNLDSVDRTRVAVDIGTGLGGAETTEAEALYFERKERKRLSSALYLPTYIANMAACQVAMTYKLHGPTTTPVAACATGTYAIGEAARMVHRGEVLVALAGGTDASLTAINTMAFGVIGAIAPPGDDPKQAIKPFDANRSGTAGAEGCGVLVLESMEHALSRGARIYAEVVGFGATEDAYHVTAPEPGAAYTSLAMQRAIEDAELLPQDVDHISAHATGTPMNDEAETAAIKLALGEHASRVAISGIKAMLGHTAGAAGALALIGCVKSIETGIIPPTINYSTPDPKCDLDYVPNAARHTKVDVALANAFGFGGQNAVVAVKRFDE